MAQLLGSGSSRPFAAVAAIENPGYRIQAAALGGLDKETLRVIRQPKGETPDSSGDRPFAARTPTMRDGAKLKAGALIAREWNGKLERVMVLDKGFAWNGETYGSLSQVAKAMTGTNWNGHRFFGLRTSKSDRSAKPGRNGRASDVAPPDVAPVESNRDRRGHIYELLSNPIYVGRIAHKGQVHGGQHPPIVDQAFGIGFNKACANIWAPRGLRKRVNRPKLCSRESFSMIGATG